MLGDVDDGPDSMRVNDTSYRPRVAERCPGFVASIRTIVTTSVHNGSMPEGLEVEIYRRAAEAATCRTIAGVWVDERCAQPGSSLEDVVGSTITAARRRGKVLALDTDGPRLGIHFGMAGRLVVDEWSPIERLEYASSRDHARWDRLIIDFDDGGRLRVNDPRRWTKVMIAPDFSNLGPDLMELTSAQFARALTGTNRPLKAVMLDQRAVAGLGNMLVDEILWWAGVAPTSIASALSARETARVHRCLRRQLPLLLARGGSHTGTLSPPVRASVPPCPRDGGQLVRTVVAGRTTIWCPQHQVVVR